MNNFTTDVVIGLEIHVQLNTTTGLFCGCPIKPAEPNTATCPICLGHPGAKPLVNEKALEYGAKVALALGCKIAPTITFSRKTYFYPDLAKNFQITQFELPLGNNGHLVLDDGTIVRIERAHLEEDPGSIIRETESVLVDYNRSGVPLCEIVTGPDMHSPEQAREFMKKLLNILGYLGVYDPNTGIVKADANVSIKEKNYTRVEVKNITGFKEIERALQYEIQRQKSQDVKLETRGWDSEKGITHFMRNKETEADYGYIVEPDLPIFEISQDWIRSIQASIPELGEQRAARWVKDWKIDETDAKIIANNLDVADLFEKVAKKSKPIIVSRWFRRDILRQLNESKLELNDTKFNENNLAETINLVDTGGATQQVGSNIIQLLTLQDISPGDYVIETGLQQISDSNELKKLCVETITEHPKAVEDYKKGEENSLQFLVGQIMRKTKGTANAQKVKELFEGLLK
ncbi:Asp-tRNA(Asn)/Glu-tRNA(Gln) amidotransferase GatCAB subunit B [Candidatus Woesearchaeota archaeon CG10_big_fil_rev_8_21_14_0_10_37_12]|nr:MAG: Asp-tRNA(Asn)/Glu-tRNA(Gln) amidotransferase GatCAB subunit B [Candidatus Woesearchaeota archaeon CG10_big_fil_rev_8_21_14_0_10_37_12]